MSEVRSSKVSIIIPVWGKYYYFLDRCLASVRSQTYKDIELIVVENKKDLPSARNEGIKKSTGEYILCLDVDDTLMPEAIEKIVQNGGDIIAFDRISTNGELLTSDKKFTFLDFIEGNRIIACSMFKRKIWEEIGGYDESLKDGYEDWDFWVRALKFGYTVSYIDEVLYVQSIRNNSMINETVKKHNELKEYICRKFTL